MRFSVFPETLSGSRLDATTVPTPIPSIGSRRAEPLACLQTRGVTPWAGTAMLAGRFPPTRAGERRSRSVAALARHTAGSFLLATLAVVAFAPEAQAQSLPVLSVNSPSVTEGDSGTTATMTFDVRLSPASADDVEVQFSTQSNLDPVNAATERVDYDNVDAHLTFTPGQTLKTVEVTVHGDDVAEPDEKVRVAFGPIVTRNAVFAPGLMLPETSDPDADSRVIFGTIVDDDTNPPGQPPDTPPATGNSPATGAPAIAGSAQVGQVLEAGAGTIADADGLTNVSYSWQWVQVDGSTETDIRGATRATYTPVAADEGKRLKVRASFTDDVGKRERRTSAATDTVLAITVVPALPLVGQALLALLVTAGGVWRRRRRTARPRSRDIREPVAP